MKNLAARDKTLSPEPPEDLIYGSRLIVQNLPAAIYTCDLQGRITYFNEAAVELWGRRPVLGQDLWCGSWKIYDTNGIPMSLDQCPMAVTLREGHAVKGSEIIVERRW